MVPQENIDKILCSHRTLQALFAGITDGLYIVDRNLNIMAINQAEAERLGKTPDSLVGQSCNPALWGEATDIVTGLVLDTFEAGEKKIWESQRDSTERGPFADRDVGTYPIFDDSGQVSQVIIFAEDVSEKRQLQASLFRSANLAAVGQLASNIAHQINNPLTVIIANTQLMEMSVEPGSDDVPIINYILEAGSQIRQIVQNLLDFSTQDSYVWFETQVEDTIDGALNLITHSLQKNNIKILKQFEELPAIIASANHLNLVWMNLLLNARDAISTGDERGVIEIRTQTVGREWVQIQIIDNGIGIPDEHRERLFHPFFTTKSNGKHLGLGLYTCRMIVDSHQGQISVNRKPETSGTVVTVRLPILGAAPAYHLKRSGPSS